MALSKSLEAVLDKAKENDEYWMDSAKFDFAIAIETKRREMGINYKTLANNLGKTPAYISKVFRGDVNLTIESMVKLARAVGCNISIQADDKDILLNMVSRELSKSAHVFSAVNRYKKALDVSSVLTESHQTELSNRNLNSFEADLLSMSFQANDETLLRVA